MPVLLLLFAGHALCDYPLQGDFLARGKNHTAPLPGVPWYQCLAAHSLIHAGAVVLITHSPWLALAELVIHAATDHAKCAGHISFNVDQAIHYGCKVLWWLIATR
jgi:hypothetical protein